ncbi:MAG: YhdH/YhfP family quinone oxidoreductase [Bacteroidota bacterium]
MPQQSFKALVVSQTPEKQFLREIKELVVVDLPEGDVLIRVRYSSLNYKDGLSASGNKGVTRTYPHIPGVDAAGVVEESASPLFRVGDEVIVHGYELGANHFGGFSEYIRVPANWVVRLPHGMTLRESMVIGTAGFTAALGIDRMLHHGLDKDDGSVVISGASGGVGSVGVVILAKLGYHVTAATRKMDEQQFLANLGAGEVVPVESIKDTSGKPLINGRWAGALDSVGGDVLDSIIRATKFWGPVATCGNVISGELHTSIYPFILRGVALIGINSAFTPMPLRLEVWRKLAEEWRLDNLDSLTTEVSLEELNEKYLDLILKGGVKGRVLVKLP